MASTWMTNHNEKSMAKHNREVAIIENEARLAQDKESHNSAWEMAQLQDKDKILRWFSYSMFTLPIIITVVNPEWGRQIFENLSYAPSWLVEVFIGLNGAIWGLSSLKNIAPSVVNQIKEIKK